MKMACRSLSILKMGHHSALVLSFCRKHRFSHAAWRSRAAWKVFHAERLHDALRGKHGVGSAWNELARSSRNLVQCKHQTIYAIAGSYQDDNPMHFITIAHQTHQQAQQLLQWTLPQPVLPIGDQRFRSHVQTRFPSCRPTRCGTQAQAAGTRRREAD